MSNFEVYIPFDEDRIARRTKAIELAVRSFPDIVTASEVIVSRAALFLDWIEGRSESS